MKTTIFSFALAFVLCGQAMAQKPSAPLVVPTKIPPLR